MLHAVGILLLSLFAHADVSDVKVVHVNQSATVRRVELTEKSILNNGDEIVVGNQKDAYVDLKFGDGHRARLKSDTTFRIGSSNKTKILLSLLKGRAFIDRVKGVDDKAIRFEVRTKSAVAGVRGTRFMIESDDVKGTYICVCEGNVDVTSVDGGASFPVRKGQDIWAKPNVAVQPASDSPSMSQMTQQEFDSMKY